GGAVVDDRGVRGDLAVAARGLHLDMTIRQRQAVVAEEPVELALFAGGERDRDVENLAAGAVENADENGRRLGGRFDQAEVRVEGGGLGDLLERKDRRRAGRLADEARDRDGRDELAERTEGGRVERAAGSYRRLRDAEVRFAGR